MTPDTEMDSAMIEALELSGKSLKYDVPPSPLAGLPTFRPPKPKPISREEARAQIQGQSVDLQAQLNTLKEQLAQLQQAAAQAELSRNLSLYQPPPLPLETPPFISAFQVVEPPAKTSVVEPPVVQAPTVSVEPSAPQTWEPPQPVVHDQVAIPPPKLVKELKDYVARKRPFASFRESVWRAGCYRTDRWPAEMLAGVEVQFNALIADEEFVASIAAAVREIDPGAPIERMFHYVSGAAGWLAWIAYITQTYGGTQ